VVQLEMIDAVGIDDNGSLWVKPASSNFRFIYRTATEVHWDEGRRCLCTPKPRDWSYARWFSQIITAVREEYRTELRIAPTTAWLNVDSALQQEFLASMNRN
jgi:hypothetical protein